MKVKDLIDYYNVETNISDSLKEHEIGLIIPPVEQYTYKHEGEIHTFTKKTGKITDSITINEKEKTVTFEKESEGLPTAGYIVHEDGSEDLM